MKILSKNVLIAAVVSGLVVAPTAAFAAHQFSDVPDDSIAHDAIARLTDAGVITGCTTTSYCPGANITRQQMALLLDRQSGNGDVAPSVDAATVMGMTPEELKGAKGDTGAAGPAGAPGAQGPTGARGADGANGSNGSNGQDGADGAQGPQGPAGAISSAYSVRADAPATSLTLALTLPANSAYVINGKLIADSNGRTTELVCDLEAASTSVPFLALDTAVETVVSLALVTVPVQATLPSRAESTVVTLSCSTGGVPFQFEQAVLTAVPVGSILPA